jgi:hypothetical protein
MERRIKSSSKFYKHLAPNGAGVVKAGRDLTELPKAYRKFKLHQRYIACPVDTCATRVPQFLKSIKQAEKF